MDTINNSEWIADLKDMTFRNNAKKITVVFEKSDKSFAGKIRDMPMELMAEWADEPEGEKHIQNAVMEAEEVFMRAYFDRVTEKNVPKSDGTGNKGR